MSKKDWNKVGYVVASDHRTKVLEALAEKPKTPTQISEETSMYLSHVSSTLSDLKKKNLAKCLTPELEKGKLYTLTEEGENILDEI